MKRIVLALLFGIAASAQLVSVAPWDGRHGDTTVQTQFVETDKPETILYIACTDPSVSAFRVQINYIPAGLPQDSREGASMVRAAVATGFSPSWVSFPLRQRQIIGHPIITKLHDTGDIVPLN